MAVRPSGYEGSSSATAVRRARAPRRGALYRIETGITKRACAIDTPDQRDAHRHVFLAAEWLLAEFDSVPSEPPVGHYLLDGVLEQSKVELRHYRPPLAREERPGPTGLA
jgi:hypothetical protein